MCMGEVVVVVVPAVPSCQAVGLRALESSALRRLLRVLLGVSPMRAVYMESFAADSHGFSVSLLLFKLVIAVVVVAQK